MSFKTTTCNKCENSGIKVVNNGLDDIDHEFCDCAIGVELENSMDDRTEEEIRADNKEAMDVDHFVEHGY